jgi:hypothetical protein
VSSFLPVPRLGLVNPEGYIAFSLFPHLSAIPLDVCAKRFLRFVNSPLSVAGDSLATVTWLDRRHKGDSLHRRLTMLTKVIRAKHRMLGRELATKIGNSYVD